MKDAGACKGPLFAVMVNEPSLSHVAILIPAWQPGAVLLRLVEELRGLGFALILVVDDGSGLRSERVFGALEVPGVRVVHHSSNLGKGRALKTGLELILREYPTVTGVVTADADGQHTVADILHVADTLARTDEPVLGARGFSQDVPWRSLLGNKLTRWIFRLTTGARLQDTQTGLRGLPVRLLPELLKLDGERYEYEMTVLVHLCRGGRVPLEVPIRTVYVDNNRGSHFDPLRDSMRIYFVLARFYFSSLLAAGADLAVFSVVFASTHHLLLSVAIGRLSSLLNFALNRRFVFHNKQPVGRALLRYYVLAVLIASLSYVLLRVAMQRMPVNVYATKIFVDAVLSLISFSVQRRFVFPRRPRASPLAAE